MSFHEKSAWACLVAIAALFGPYFFVTFTRVEPLPFFADTIAVLGISLILAVALAVVHIVFALTSAYVRRQGALPPPDEREARIELLAAKIAGLVLGMVVLLWCLTAYVGIPVNTIQELAANQPPAPDFKQFAVRAQDAMFFVNLLFAGFVLANVVYYAAMVIGYRRSA